MGTWEAWLTLSIVAAFLIGHYARVASTMMLALLALWSIVAVQQLWQTPLLPTPTLAVAGFGNESLVAIGLLFVVVAGLEMTGGTQLATGWLLKHAKGLTDAQVRVLVPVAIVSGFLNNTPVVAALLPVVNDLGKRIRVSPSRLLLPLSYAAIVGGMCTLMGTSTNLIVNTKYQEFIARENAKIAAAKNDGQANAVGDGVTSVDASKKTRLIGGLRPLGFFAPAIIGVPATIAALIYIMIATRYLLPARRAAVSRGDDMRQYTVEMRVKPGGPMVGQTIESAGLRSLPGLFLADIERDGALLGAVGPTETLRGDDLLILVGDLESVVDLQKFRGLLIADDEGSKLNAPAWKR
ncbi:MAG: SLC13 family permease, partial [Planctomycetota bacterium]